MVVIVSMLMTHLRTVDLNLLVILDALLEERSVTRAGRRLGMSQPAVSRALTRLRGLFSDPLLVESRSGYLLTPRARDIRPDLQAMLAGVDAMLEASPYDPSTASGTFRLFVTDLHAAALIPRLLVRLDA
ncbi:LysR family transcriptional regulator, partial [Escherichia coli]|nr:LysR family transcriptional regulator [Escherichia coli]